MDERHIADRAPQTVCSVAPSQRHTTQRPTTSLLWSPSSWYSLVEPAPQHNQPLLHLHNQLNDSPSCNKTSLLPKVIWEEGCVAAKVYTYAVKLQWRVPNSPPKVPLPVDRSPNPTTCLIPGPVQPMMPNGIRIQSAVFPQSTGQTDRPTDKPTDRLRKSFMTIGRYASNESDVA